MAYVAPIHQPTSVRHALRAHIFSAEEESLVLSKANRLEIWRFAEGFLSLVYSKPVNGTIAILQKLQPIHTQTDILFVGTERFEYFTLIWNQETAQLEMVEAFRDPGERHMRESHSQDKALVDPSGKHLVLHLWAGVINVMRLGVRKDVALKLVDNDQVRLSELFIKASTLLYTETGHPKIAFLYQNTPDSTDSKLATYRVTSDDRDRITAEFKADRERDIDCDISDPRASLLIPVRKVEEEIKRHNVRNVESARAHIGGLIVVGETRLMYIDEVTKTTVESALKKPNIFVAWAEYDATHYFLADDYGGLHLLSILTEGVVVQGMSVDRIGNIPRANELVYFDSGMLFVASHYGDSQLLKIDLTNEESDQLVQPIQTLANLGPITDFAVMDMGNRGDENQMGNEYSSGQARIVAGCGVYRDGSLRSVRSGVGLQDVGILADLQHTRALFPLKSYNSEKTDTLAVSFLTESRVFRFDAQGDVEEVESFCGMTLDCQTLLAVNLPNGHLLQVTTTGAALLDLESGVGIASWAPEGERTIINASANENWLLLSVEGTSLVTLSLTNQLMAIAQKEINPDDQVACVHVAPGMPNIGVVGFWTSGTVSILSLDTLELIRGASLRQSDDDASIPRDLALVQILPASTSGPTLFIAMEDGNVVTFEISPDMEFLKRKRVVLGTRQAKLHLLPQENGVFNIFATTEHPSLIYGEQGRIIYSAVTANEATCICPFDTEAFPDCIIVATDSSLRISQIDRMRRTHLQSLPIGEMIRRISYSPKEKVFGMGCIKREISDGKEVIQSFFRLVDEIMFRPVGKPIRFETLGYTEIVESVVRAEMRDSYGNLVERFILGTSYTPDPEYAAHVDHTGRILVVGIDENRDPYIILSHPTRSQCRCLGILGRNKIVAGLSKTLVVAEYEETSTTTAKLTLLASHKPATHPVALEVKDNTIGLVDLMKSMTLVEFVSGDEKENRKPQLVERARHFESVTSTALCHVDGDEWLQSDDQGNLLMLQRNLDAVTAYEQKSMRVTAAFNLGEIVNRIRPIRVETSPGAMIVPRAFLGTVEGGIYMFGTIAPQSQDLLLRFQEKLAEILPAFGGVEFTRYRAFRNSEREGDGPVRFLDGEMLERFLDVDEATQKEICEGLGPSVEMMRDMVEELRRMH
ncbi:hypothetical protein QBC38DRAFT_221708 [Podospora fimiseda]|uniref:DNA damage-binding protein 1 n=1 Tax=Podospora fimiseda TaxID=252190 RepID=A0AAN7H1C6_9PEZI|nr:hypothetical protein QBC38DRAFT_221708 [Podospora fimiseda]